MSRAHRFGRLGLCGLPGRRTFLVPFFVCLRDWRLRFPLPARCCALLSFSNAREISVMAEYERKKEFLAPTSLVVLHSPLAAARLMPCGWMEIHGDVFVWVRCEYDELSSSHRFHQNSTPNHDSIATSIAIIVNDRHYYYHDNALLVQIINTCTYVIMEALNWITQ